jgi:hypothetical protein
MMNGPEAGPDDRTDDMAKYLVLIYGDEQVWDAQTPEQREANSEGHRAFASKASPGILGGHRLAPTTMSTSLRAGTAGRPTVTDGPFLETKEVLGGYYLLEAADLDEAIAVAGQLPEVWAPTSGVEIRPIREAD